MITNLFLTRQVFNCYSRTSLQMEDLVGIGSDLRPVAAFPPGLLIWGVRGREAFVSGLSQASGVRNLESVGTTSPQ